MTSGTVAAVQDDAVADLLRIGTDDIRSSESRRKSLAGSILTDDRLTQITIDIVEHFLGGLAQYDCLRCVDGDIEISFDIGFELLEILIGIIEILRHLFEILLVLQKDPVELALGILQDIDGIIVDIGKTSPFGEEFVHHFFFFFVFGHDYSLLFISLLILAIISSLERFSALRT